MAEDDGNGEHMFWWQMLVVSRRLASRRTPGNRITSDNYTFRMTDTGRSMAEWRTDRSNPKRKTNPFRGRIWVDTEDTRWLAWKASRQPVVLTRKVQFVQRYYKVDRTGFRSTPKAKPMHGCSHHRRKYPPLRLQTGFETQKSS
jgi:hypothetical protein